MKKFRIFHQTKLGKSLFDGFIIKVVCLKKIRKGAETERIGLKSGDVFIYEKKSMPVLLSSLTRNVISS